MEYKIGDKVIINSINTKGTVVYIAEGRGSTYYVIDYYDAKGGFHSTGFKGQHIRLDKEYYRKEKINKIVK